MTDPEQFSSTPGQVVNTGAKVTPGGDQGPVGSAGGAGAPGPTGPTGTGGGGGGSNKGTTTINFGAFPGSLQASVTITGQTGILTSSVPTAFSLPVATADHSVDEQILDRTQFALVCANVIAGTGFTIYAQANARLYGQYNIAWVWN